MKANHPDSRLALLTLVEIQAAVEDFNQGDSNIFEALDRIRVAIRLLENTADSERKAA